jgi:hypothetical protein
VKKKAQKQFRQPKKKHMLKQIRDEEEYQLIPESQDFDWQLI